MADKSSFTTEEWKALRDGPQLVSLAVASSGASGLIGTMKEMFSSIKTDDNDFGGGFGEETWRGMQAEQFSSAMADQGGIGLADQLMPTLLKMQEAN